MSHNPLDAARSEGFALGQSAQIETLRDRFAMAAIQGFCSQCDATGMWSWKPSDAAEFAYQVADAMMEGRSRE